MAKIWWKGSELAFLVKGQLISKANFLVFTLTKKQTKLFFDFCPKDLKWVKSKKWRHFILLIRGYLFNTIDALFFYLTQFISLGQKSKNSFIRFLVQMRTRKKFAPEIYWPLVKQHLRPEAPTCKSHNLNSLQF